MRSDIHSLNAVVACCDKIEDDNLQLFPVARTTNETFGILKYVVGQREQTRYSHHKLRIYDLCSYLITFLSNQVCVWCTYHIASQLDSPPLSNKRGEQ